MKKVNLIAIAVAVLLLVGASGSTYYFYRQWQQSKWLLENPEAAAQTEIGALVAKISKLMVLPEDEQPTVASVLDAEKLKDQAFFAKAVNGDKVIIYTKAMKAILYRQSENKIIEVAPINISQPEAQSQAPAQPNSDSSKPKVEKEPTATESPTKTPTKSE